MENPKKPRLDLSSESDYETYSDTDAESSSSDESSTVFPFVRSSSLPSLTSLKSPPPATPNASLFTKPKVPKSTSQPIPSTSTTTTTTMPSSATNVPQATSSQPNVPPQDEDLLRSSFRNACEELNRDLDSVMHPAKTSKETYKAVEDYLVSLSRKATQPFKVDLADDPYSKKVSLQVDKNNVSIIAQNTPNQEGKDTQQSEGAAALPGPSRVVHNTAYWMPPVNPFTSSVTLRQHLEAASNSARPRRIRPPPGFHPTPQYNVKNLGASGADAPAGQGTSGVVRPPPGFHGIANSSAASVAGASTSELSETHAVIADLYRQSLAVVRQNANAILSNPSSNQLVGGTTPEQLLYTLVPRRGNYQRRSDRYRPTQPFRANQYQAPTSATSGNDLWQHFSNAAAASNPGNGPGYWDDFLQSEVYDCSASDQNSDLWRQFDEYQRVHYAPGSLRCGSTTFNSDKTGPSKHGPIGQSRPRSQPPPGRGRPIDVPRIIQPQQLRQPPQFGCGQSTQDITTLSDRFKNVAIGNIAPVCRPPTTRNNPVSNRNAMLGALLLKRLKERVAIANPETNPTINFPASASTSTALINTNTTSSSQGRTVVTTSYNAINNAANNATNNPGNSATTVITLDHPPCPYCLQNNRGAGIPTHVLRDVHGRTVCPILRMKPCPICNQAGDNAHTVHDCPVRKQWNLDDDKGGKKSA